MAIASGIIVLFFIQAFDLSQSSILLLQKWFIGLLISGVNFTFTELFCTRWEQANKSKNLKEKLQELENCNDHQSKELTKTKSELERSRKDFDQLFLLTEELKKFKTEELRMRMCEKCSQVFKSQYHLNSHRGRCA